MKADRIWVNSMGYGDNHWHCQYLTKLGGSHVLHCREHHHNDLRGMFPNIEFRGMESLPTNAIDCWIGAQYPFSWHAAYCDRDLVKFLGETWFEGLSKQIGVENPIRNREDMLYDAPKVHDQTKGIFVVNSHPRSGQVDGFTNETMEKLVKQMCFGFSIFTTTLKGNNMSGMFEYTIISQLCKAIAGVATGPIWPCLSVQNLGKPTYLLLTQVFLDYGSWKPKHFSSVPDMIAAMKEDRCL